MNCSGYIPSFIENIDLEFLYKVNKWKSLIPRSKALHLGIYLVHPISLLTINERLPAGVVIGRPFGFLHIQGPGMD
jgi:hypothetical protein